MFAVVEELAPSTEVTEVAPPSPEELAPDGELAPRTEDEVTAPSPEDELAPSADDEVATGAVVDGRGYVELGAADTVIATTTELPPGQRLRYQASPCLLIDHAGLCACVCVRARACECAGSHACICAGAI